MTFKPLTLILLAVSLVSLNCRAQSVVFNFERYSGGANYFWLFNGDYESVNTTRSHEHIQVTLECATADCSALKLSYKNPEAPESYETYLTARKLEEILTGKERQIKIPSQTKKAFNKAWEIAIDLDGPGVGIFIPIGAFLTVVGVPFGAASDLYNACHGDGSCKVKLKDAVEKVKALKDLPGETVTLDTSSSEITDLARFTFAIGERYGAPSLELLSKRCDVILDQHQQHQ